MDKLTFLLAFLLALFTISCEKPEEDESGVVIVTPDWTETTHGAGTNPDYSIVFPQDMVLRFDIVLDADNWQAMIDDLANAPKTGPGQNTDNEFVPVWKPCELFFNGFEWYKVGIRFKGNSSLMSTYSAGIKKFSLKLDFDQFEDAYPAIKNQRFYGFKQLNLNNNFEDKSEMREKVAGDLFREFGIPVAQSAFAEVYVDVGNGSQYFGLYSLVEEIDNTGIPNLFTEDTGNLYKPEGTSASFAPGIFSTADFYKKSNEDLADWSDINALYNAINSSLRTTNQEDWRALMESNLNMDEYLKWLAANTTIQNWDTYGKMPHNYYLYHDPESSVFFWIPWDNNEALQDGKQGGAINLDLTGVTDQWPLISYIAADNQYYSIYKKNVKDFVSNVFVPDKMIETYNTYSNLIKESVLKEEEDYTFLNSNSDFDVALEQLKQQVVRRAALASELK